MELYMNSILKLSIVLILILLFNSCDILDNNSSTIEPLDSKINFKVLESFDRYETVSAPEIFIEMQTEKIYGCYNYGISTYSRFEDRKVIVDIRGISKPGVCLTALGPANARIRLGYISGVYEIEFNGNNFNDKYNLLISDSLIILDGKETANTNPSVYFMYRYPKNSFAYLCGTLLSDSSLCSKFIDTLQSVISITEFHFSDIAEIPYPKSSQGHYYDADARYFYYHTESDFEKIREAMKNFKQSYFPDNHGTGLSIISWMNKKIYSWIL
jgi:hypothetical protein